MTLVEDFQLIGEQSYSIKSPLGLQQPIFETLESVRSHLRAILPSRFSVSVSRGVGGLPQGLWVAILDDDVTKTPTEGLYLVFLFNTSRTSVSLSLNQGITRAADVARSLPLTRNQLLRSEADRLRALLRPQIVAKHETEISLGSGVRVSGYQSGNVLARTWSLGDLPSEFTMEAELHEFLDIYEEAVESKENNLTLHPGHFRTPARGSPANKSKAPIFAPKSSSDYETRSKSYVEPQVRRRDHERLVKQFGEYASGRGFVPATNHHPIDLVLTSGDVEILVEVKILDWQHPAGGIRESIGQLFEYRKFLRSDWPATPLLAVYNFEPSAVFVELLTDLEISAAWRSGHTFERSPLAKSLGL